MSNELISVLTNARIQVELNMKILTNLIDTNLGINQEVINFNDNVLRPSVIKLNILTKDYKKNMFQNISEIDNT